MKDRLRGILNSKSIEKLGVADRGGWRVLEVSPILIPIFLSSFGLIAILLLCLGHLSNFLLLLIAVPFALSVTTYSALRLNLRFPGTIKERRIGMLAIVALALMWAVVNTHYSSEDVYINRDPGSYNVTARWIMDHDNLVIYSSHVFGKAPSIASDTAGYGEVAADHDGRLYPQAPHLFPILIGLVGRIAGPSAMMGANAFIGALSLFVLYGFIRIFVRPRWAILAVAILSVSLPMFYFSRDTYTEPLTLLLIFSALSTLIAARAVGGSALWAIAGVVAASSTLVRIDAFLLLAGFIGSVFILALLKKGIKKGAIISFLAGLFITAFVGFWDVAMLSKRYFIDLRFEFIAQIALIVVALLAGTATLYWERRNGSVGRFFHSYKKLILKWLLIGIVIFGAFLVSRPMWMVSHEAGNPYSRPYIASLQAKEGSKIDDHRNYAEYSTYWITWYIGPLVALLGFAGFLLCVKSAFEEEEGVDLIPLLLVFGAMAALYFLMPKITADQIWAIRRFLPVIIPGLCFFAVVALHRAYDLIARRKQKIVIGILLLVLLFTPVIFISFPFVRSKEFAGQLAQIEKVCKTLPNNSAVLLVGQNGINMTQTIRSYCHVPAERLPQPTKESLASVARTARHEGYAPVAFVIGYESGFLSKKDGDFTNVGSVKYEEMERELTRPPHIVNGFERNILMAVIKNDGGVEPITKGSL